MVRAVLVTAASTVKAQEDLVKQSQNPLGAIISLPFENNVFFDIGPSNTEAYVLNLKPVYPVRIGNWNLINRLILPVTYLEGQDSLPARRGRTDLGEAGEVFPTDDEFGLGDTTYQTFCSATKPAKLICGVGPAFVIPTNTSDELGIDKWSAGVSGVALAMPGKWVVGALAQNVWDFAGDDDEPDVNKFLFQYFVNYNLEKGWYLSSTPNITANWEADSGEKWTIPFGGGVGRLLRFGKQPVDFKLAAYWNAEHPENGPEWSLQFTVKFLFPK